MTTHTLKLPEDLELELDSLVRATMFTKTYFLTEAFREYIAKRKFNANFASIMAKVSSGEIKVKSLNNLNPKLAS